MNFDIGTWVAIAAFVIATATMMVTGLGILDTARKSYVDDLAAQIVNLRSEVARYKTHADECDRKLTELKDDHFMLMRKILTPS